MYTSVGIFLLFFQTIILIQTIYQYHRELLKHTHFGVPNPESLNFTLLGKERRGPGISIFLSSEVGQQTTLTLALGITT